MLEILAALVTGISIGMISSYFIVAFWEDWLTDKLGL